MSKQANAWDAVFDQADRAFKEADRAFDMADEAFKRGGGTSRSFVMEHEKQTIQFASQTWGERWNNFCRFAKMAFSSLCTGTATLTFKKRK